MHTRSTCPRHAHTKADAQSLLWGFRDKPTIKIFCIAGFIIEMDTIALRKIGT